MKRTMKDPIFFELVEAERSTFSAGVDGVWGMTAVEGELFEVGVVGAIGDEEEEGCEGVSSSGYMGASWRGSGTKR